MKAKTVIVIIVLNIIITTITSAFFHYGGLSYVHSKLFTPPPKTDPTIALDMKYRIEQIAYYNSLPSPMPSSIVFLGDSHIKGCNWAKLYKNPQIINYGIPGNTTRDVIERLGPVVERKPQKIFLMVGINDITNRIEEDSIVANYQIILDTIKIQSPNTLVYVHSIIPPNFMVRQDLSFVKPDMIRSINLKLQKLCVDNNVVYIDLYSRFTTGGELEYFNSIDGVHLNTPGYQEWGAILEEYI